MALNATINTPVTHGLHADVDPDFTLEWRLGDGAALPPGLALRTDGTVTGIPTQEGSGDTKVKVRGTVLGTSGSWISGSLNWTVGPPAKCFSGGDSGDVNITAGDDVLVFRSDTQGPWDFPHLRSYQGQLDWGDGASTATEWGGGPYRHTYPNPGSFRVERSGAGVLQDGRACVDEGSGFQVHVQARDTLRVDQQLNRGD